MAVGIRPPNSGGCREEINDHLSPQFLTESREMGDRILIPRISVPREIVLILFDRDDKAMKGFSGPQGRLSIHSAFLRHGAQSA